jgi:hypothetical protein
MSFMYIHLRKLREGDIEAAVFKHGSLPSTSVGSENSRMTHGPFAVFQVDHFVGLENIDTSDLLEELQRRFTPAQLMQTLQFQFSSKELLAIIAERME